MQANKKNRHTIVIVEDDFLIAAAYSTMCEEIGVDVLEICDNAEAGIVAIATHQPTFALLDVHLASGRDGVHVATAIRQNEIDTNIIFATGSFDPGTLNRLHGIGAFNVLVKPIDPADFAAALSGSTGSTDSGAPPVSSVGEVTGQRTAAYIAQMTRRQD